MSSTPRAWPGVTVPEDYYDGEIFGETLPPSSSEQRTARPTHAASRHRPRLTAAWVGLAVALSVILAVGDERLRFLRLLVLVAMYAVSTIGRRRDVVFAEAGSSLLMHRRSASTESLAPTEVTSDAIACVRPCSTNRFVRYFRPEVWQVGSERIIVGSTPLSSLLHRLTEDRSS